MYCQLKGQRWPSQLIAPRLLVEGIKRDVVNLHTITGALEVFRYLGWHTLGERLWQEREERGLDPVTGQPEHHGERE